MGISQRFADVVKPHVGVQVRSRVVRSRFAARGPSAGMRMLPDFLVIGAMRGGTSSLYKYLSQHPDVAPSLRKEIDYFSRHYDRGERWYRQHFALRTRRQLAEIRGRQLLTFEATPYYLFDPRCPARAQALLPSARQVVLLRDPVERAFSDYQHMCRLGFEDLSFAAALDAEPRRLAPELARMAEDPGYFSRAHHHFSYFSRGLYAEQLERWLAVYPTSSLLLVESKDLYDDPAQCVTTVLDFLGLRRWAPARFRNYSYVGAPPQRSKVDQGLQRELRTRYAVDDRRLAEMWGRIPSWRAGG